MQNRTYIEGKVTHFPYRTAMVRGALVTAPTSHHAELWEELANTAGVRPENHQVYGVTNEAGETVYFMFSDNVVSIGTQIVEGSW
jgi:hypothetical protein